MRIATFLKLFGVCYYKGTPYTLRTIIEKDGKFFHGYVPTLLGCHTFGKTIEETQENLKDAIKVCIESITKEKGTTSGAELFLMLIIIVYCIL